MFRPQAQAETHSRPGRALRGSRPPCAETHSKRPGPPRASSGTYFFLFLNRLQAQAHSNRVGQPLSSRALCRNLFFFYLFLDYKHKRAPWHSSSGPGWPRAFLLTAHKI